MTAQREKEFLQAFEDRWGYFKLFSPTDDDPKDVALWAFSRGRESMREEAGNIANRIMSEQTDPKLACLAQQIKLEIRALNKYECTCTNKKICDGCIESEKSAAVEICRALKGEGNE